MNKKHTVLIGFFFLGNALAQTKVLQILDNGNLIIENNKKFAISKDSANGIFKFDTICKSKRADYLFTKKNNFWGIINQANQVIIPNRYQTINTACCYGNLNGKDNFIVRRDDKVGVINYNNKILIPIIYDKITNWVEHGPKAHYVSKKNKIGLIKHNGEIMIPVSYDSLYYYNDSIIKGKNNHKFGVLNSKKTVIIPFDYDALIVDFNTDGLEDENHINKFVVKKNGFWYYLDYSGNIIEKEIPTTEIEKKYDSFELKNYDFEYIGKILNSTIKNYF